jgi:hypothetical protein
MGHYRNETQRRRSGPSVYVLIRAAPNHDRRRSNAVVETATPTAALGVHQAVGVALAWPPLPLRP